MRNEIMGVKGNHTKLAKRVDDIEKKWNQKFAPGQAKEDQLPNLSPNQKKAFGLALLFLIFQFYPQIKASFEFLRELYLSGKQWASTTFEVLSVVISIILSISFYLAILIVIYMILSYIPIMKARMAFIRSKVSLVTDKIMRDIPIIKTLVDKISGG